MYGKEEGKNKLRKEVRKRGKKEGGEGQRKEGEQRKESGCLTRKEECT